MTLRGLKELKAGILVVGENTTRVFSHHSIDVSYYNCSVIKYVAGGKKLTCLILICYVDCAENIHEVVIE